MKTDLGKREVDNYLLEQGFWDAHCKILLARGIDLNKVSKEWAVNQKQTFASPEARSAYEELCQRGCTPQVFAVLFALFRFSPRLERIWDEMTGSAKKRQKVSRALDRTASMLEDILRDLIDAENEKVWADYAQLEHVPPSRLISELRFYRQFLNLSEALALDTQTRSLNDFSKYLLASYVKRATGKFRDRAVSALLAEVVGPFDFDEVAQRMWRFRNYLRLQRHFSKATDFLFAMGVVIARRT